MFKAKTTEGKWFKGVVDGISTLIEEALVEVREDGIGIAATDPGHVSLLFVEIRAPVFDGGYECEKPFSFGLQFEDLSKILKRVAGGSMEMWFDDKKQKFHVRSISDSSRTFTLPGISIAEDKLPPGTEVNVEFKSIAKLSAAYIDEAIKDAVAVGETVRITLEEGGIRLKTEGTSGETEFFLGADKFESYEFGGRETAVYTVERLKEAMKVAENVDVIQLAIGEQLMQLKFIIQGAAGGDDCGHILYYIAPRADVGEDASEDE